MDVNMKTWEELENECGTCTRCSLSQTRHNCVFGAGNKNAKLKNLARAYTHKQNFKRRKESRKNYSKNNANKKGGDKMEENMKTGYIEPDLKLGMIMNTEIRVGASCVGPK